MNEQKRVRGGPAAPSETLAEIQARLEICENDLEQKALGDGRPARRGPASLREEADQIERMLEELMDPGSAETEEPEGPEESGGQPDGRWTPELEAMYREEEDAADRLAQSETDRHRRSQPGSTHRTGEPG